MSRSARVISIVIALIAAATAAVFVACETPIAPAYLLNAPRILAVRTNPVDLAPGGQVTIDSLVYTPPGSPAPAYQWSWCASVGTTLQCATTAAELTTLLDPDGSNGVNIDYALGSSPTATFKYPVEPALIQAACARRPDLDAGEDAGDAGEDAGEDLLDEAGTVTSVPIVLEGGVIARLACGADSLTVYILLTVTVGDKTMQAVQDLTLDLVAPTSTNTNPTIVGLAPFTASVPSDAGVIANPGDEADGAVEDAGIRSVAGGAIAIAADVPVTATDLYEGRTGTFELDAFAPVTTGTTCVPLEAGADGGEDGSDEEETDGGDDGGAVVCTPVGPEVYESLGLAWFVESGEIESPTTSMRSVAQGAPQDWSAALLNRWTPPAQAGTYEIIVVARDNRGGVGWLVQPAKTP